MQRVLGFCLVTITLFVVAIWGVEKKEERERELISAATSGYLPAVEPKEVSIEDQINAAPKIIVLRGEPVIIIATFTLVGDCSDEQLLAWRDRIVEWSNRECQAVGVIRPVYRENSKGEIVRRVTIIAVPIEKYPANSLT